MSAVLGSAANAPPGSAPVETLVLELMPESELVDARFRLIAAIVLAPVSATLVAVGGLVAVVLGILGLLVSLMWAAGYARARRQARLTSAPRRALVLSPTALVVEAGESRESVAWDDVADIDLDDDAATLLVRRATGSPVRIEPGYGDLDTISLHRVLERYRHGANPPTRG